MNLYRVDGFGRFTELQHIGKRSVVHEVSSDAFPERVLVMEMAQCAEQRYVPITPAEFERAFQEHLDRGKKPFLK